MITYKYYIYSYNLIFFIKILFFKQNSSVLCICATKSYYDYILKFFFYKSDLLNKIYLFFTSVHVNQIPYLAKHTHTRKKNKSVANEFESIIGFVSLDFHML